jgi:hypothetical protein
LIRNFGQAQDAPSEDALAQAISQLANNLSKVQAQREAQVLLKEFLGNVTPKQAKALALVFSAFAPKLDSNTAAEIRALLLRIVSSTKDPDVMSAAAASLFSLEWTPTAAESDRIVGSVTGALKSATGPVQIENISTLLSVIVPMLSRQSVQLAFDSIRSMPPSVAEAIKPVTLALSARLEQGAPAQPTQPTGLLLQRIAAGRWCVGSKSYTLQVNGSTAVWRDNLGSVDVEGIKSNTAMDAQTITQKSFHPDSKSEEIDTIWFYHQQSDGKIGVRSNSKSFSLSRC